jgi:hypothetical protein
MLDKIKSLLRRRLVFGSPPQSQGLGDLLLLTPLCREFPNSVVEITPKAMRFASLFYGIADVRITETPHRTPDKGYVHYAKAKLNALGRPNAGIIPMLKFFPDELDSMRREMQERGIDGNAVVFAANCKKEWQTLREFQREGWQELLNEISKRYTIIHVGVSSNITRFEKTHEWFDLDIRKQAALFHLVGKYIGIETGDHHLVLATGGKALILLAPEADGYDHKRWIYTDEHWTHEPKRAAYIPFSDYKNLLQQLNFLDS